MATNRLAPKNHNALLIDAAQSQPEYREISGFLGKRIPAANYGYLPEGVFGRFMKNSPFGNELPPEGQIEINSAFLDSNRGPSAAMPTLTHEMVHAAQGPMTDMYYAHNRGSQTPEMQQFIDAYNRLEFSPYQAGMAAYPRSAMSAKLGGLDWHNKNAKYRTSETELPAQAIGNAMRSDSRGPLHLDPTLATEYRILLDLATRAKNSIGTKK